MFYDNILSLNYKNAHQLRKTSKYPYILRIDTSVYTYIYMYICYKSVEVYLKTEPDNLQLETDLEN